MTTEVLKGLAVFFSSLYMISMLLILIFSLVQLQLLILFLRKKQNSTYHPQMPDDESAWPQVTIQLPLYNEPHVVERLLDAIATIHYPPEKLDIQVLDDSTDETTTRAANKISELSKNGLPIRLIHRENRIGYKAGALAYGLQQTNGEYLAVFDADFMPDPDFLLKTLPWLIYYPENGVVQTRWGHLNENYSPLTRLQSFQLNVHFVLEQTARNKGDLMLQFNGTAGVWRRVAIEEAGGWDHDTLTEDLDLSYRTQLAGWKIQYLNQLETPGEVPAEMRGYRTQQFRWMKGGAETARKILPLLWRAPITLRRKIHGTFHLMAGSIYVLLFISAFLSVPVLWLWPFCPLSRDILAVFLVAILIAITIFYTANTAVNKNSDGRMPYVFKFLVLFPLFLALSLGLSLHNSIAIIQGWLGRKTPFIRTPKWNLTSEKRMPFNLSRAPLHGDFYWTEALLSIYFAAGIWYGLAYGNYTFLLYHILLASGFAVVFWKTAFPSKWPT